MLISRQMRHDRAPVRCVAVFDDKYALPGAEHDLAVGDRQRQAVAGQHGLDVRGHVVGPFGGVFVAFAFGLRVDLMASEEGSAFGAAVLGMEALELVDSVDVASELLEVGSRVEPDEHDAAVYARLRPLFGDLYHALEPTYERLRELALPLERGPADVAPEG